MLCCLIAIGMPMAVFSQGLGLSQEQVTVEVRPLITKPNQPVSLKVVSYSTDINRAEVSLYVDGALIEQAVGLKEMSVDAPAVGETTAVRVVIKTIDQGTVTKNISLTPSQVDLLFEATNSYVPPMYLGKKLPAHEGGVRVAAIPYLVNSNGQKLDPKSLVYTWKVDDQVQGDVSGYGRDTFEFKGSPYYKTRSVSVQVESVDQALVAERTIDIPAFDPVARFYVEHPLWGTDLSQAIIAEEPLLLEVPEMEIRSVPFFVSDSQSRSAVTYDWRMNGEKMNTFGDRDIINLRAPAEGEGQARIDLKITHNEKLLQIAQSVFTVVFGEEAVRRAQENTSSGNTNFFGTSN